MFCISTSYRQTRTSQDQVLLRPMLEAICRQTQQTSPTTRSGYTKRTVRSSRDSRTRQLGMPYLSQASQANGLVNGPSHPNVTGRLAPTIQCGTCTPALQFTTRSRTHTRTATTHRIAPHAATRSLVSRYRTRSWSPFPPQFALS